MGFFNDLFGDPKGKKVKLEVERLHKEWSEDGWWPYRKVQENAKYAFAVSNGVIREVYRINSWRERREGDRDYKRNDRSKPRWGFPDGCAVASEMSHYVNKSVKHLFKTGDQTVNKFINCG